METSRSRGRTLDNTEPVRQTAGEEIQYFSVLLVKESLFVLVLACVHVIFVNVIYFTLPYLYITYLISYKSFIDLCLYNFKYSVYIGLQ